MAEERDCVAGGRAEYTSQFPLSDSEVVEELQSIPAVAIEAFGSADPVQPQHDRSLTCVFAG